MSPWLWLAIAIVSELIGTTALKASRGFTRLWPSLLVVAGYGAAFYGLSLAIQVLPLGLSYAIWSGVGVAATAVIGRLLFGERLGLARLGGLALVVGGVVVLQISSGGG
ncbi:MAG: multidrug efflux SMR transporter [Chloroflexi bacterium]|nr:multidrug efflux SMR transporter [Chloroflexota bacterium]